MEGAEGQVLPPRPTKELLEARELLPVEIQVVGEHGVGAVHVGVLALNEFFDPAAGARVGHPLPVHPRVDEELDRYGTAQSPGHVLQPPGCIVQPDRREHVVPCQLLDLFLGPLGHDHDGLGHSLLTQGQGLLDAHGGDAAHLGHVGEERPDGAVAQAVPVVLHDREDGTAVCQPRSFTDVVGPCRAVKLDPRVEARGGVGAIACGAGG